MNAPADVLHVITDGLELRLPETMTLARVGPGEATGGADADTEGRLVLLAGRRAAGGHWPTDALAWVRRRYGHAQPLGVGQASAGPGWEGHAEIVAVERGPLEPLRMVVTTLELPDPADPARRLAFAFVLELGEKRYTERPMFHRRFLELRLKLRRPAAAESEPVARKPPALPATAVAAAAAADSEDDHDLLAQMAQGQRTLAVCVLLSFLLSGVSRASNVAPLLSVALGVGLLFYALSGVLKICSGFGMSKGAKLALMFASTVPLVAPITWIILSVRTTSRLREAGYEVGLLGAKS